jgi:hypothetical protein
MGNYNTVTKRGHNMYDMASMLQKAIRRGEVQMAGYAAYELFGSYHTYLWRRLIIISAEDCWGIITKEIIALKAADDELNKRKQGYDKDHIFVSKAIVLLCLARKNRDGCYVACNFMNPDSLVSPDEIEHVDIATCELLDGEIPGYVFDCHTLRGKRHGETVVDMVVREQEALAPKQLGLFDYGDWSVLFDQEVQSGKLPPRAVDNHADYFSTRVLDPTDIQQWKDRCDALQARVNQHDPRYAVFS